MQKIDIRKFEVDKQKINMNYIPYKCTVVVFYAEKGGTGKTTNVGNLAIHCVLHGMNTLLIDGDPQKHETEMMNITKGKGCSTTGSLLIDGISTNDDEIDELYPTSLKNTQLYERIKKYASKYAHNEFDPDIVNVNELGNFDIFTGATNTEKMITDSIQNSDEFKKDPSIFGNKLRRIVDIYRGKYDIILIDTPAATDGRILSDIIVTVGDSVIFPIDGSFAAQGAIKCATRIPNIFEKYGSQNLPNMFFFMNKAKQSKDDVNKLSKISPKIENIINADQKAINPLHAIFNHHLPENTCVNVVKNLSNVQKSYYDHFAMPKNNNLTELYNELLTKIKNNKNNSNVIKEKSIPILNDLKYFDEIRVM